MGSFGDFLGFFCWGGYFIVGTGRRGVLGGEGESFWVLLGFIFNFIFEKMKIILK